MILAYHVIFCAYGFWLPTDPRGSWSTFVASWELLKFGPATKVHSRRSLAHTPHDHALRLAAKKSLKYPPVSFTGHQAVHIANAIAQICNNFNVSIFACSILPEHIHLVLGPTTYRIPYLVNQMKGKATAQFIESNSHPLATFAYAGAPPTPWARNCWKHFLYSRQAVLDAIHYVRCNPVKEGKRAQHWKFIAPFF